MQVHRAIAVVLAVLALAPRAQAEDGSIELTAAGKAVLADKLAADGRPLYDRPGPSLPLTFPLPMCTFPGGLCGAVRRDGSAAVPPRYDWVGRFSDGRAAVRVGGLYGFVDEVGREIVPPQYRIVDDYKFGFAQVDVGGRSGLIDREGRLVIEPRYGSIEAVAPDRFRVSDVRWLGGMTGAEDFSGLTFEIRGPGSVAMTAPMPPDGSKSGIIDRAGQWIERPGRLLFDPDDRSIGIVSENNRWGVQRADGSWLAKPQFNQVDALSNGLARVRVDGRYGFIDRSGQVVIAPVFDEAQAFLPSFPYTPVRQGKSAGAIDRTGAWVFRIDADAVRLAVSFERSAAGPFGWHFRKDDKWGLLDDGGHVLLNAEFDQPVERCTDGRLVAYRNKEWLYFRGDGSPLQPQDGRLLNAGCGSVPPYILKLGDKFALADGDGKEITPPIFEGLIAATTGIWNAKVDGKWGRIGPDGHWLIEPKFDYLSRSSPIIVAAADIKRGFLKPDGSWLIEPKFDAARARDAETAFVTINGATGVIGVKDQSWVVAPRPGVMCDIPYGILSQSEGRRALLAHNGEAWIDIAADRIGFDFEAGLLPFLKDGKWGLIDTAGQVAIQPIYDDQVSFRQSFRGIAWARHDGRWCPIDRHGRDVPGIACVERNPLGEGRSYFRCAVEP